MNRIAFHRKLLLGLVFATICLAVGSCASDSSSDSAVQVLYELRVQNKSQFELHHVFIDESEENYKETESLTQTRLKEDQYVSRDVPSGRKYKVTVTRLKNKDDRLLAYTTLYPFPVKIHVCWNTSTRASG